MKRIRPFQDSDVDDVAGLYEAVIRSGRRNPAPGLTDWLQRVVLDQPWADDEVPSLVATNGKGEVVGFLASHVRRFCFDGDEIRLGCSGQLVVDEQGRRSATGAMLLASYLRGPQDFSITDGATEEVSIIWERLGGERAPLQQLTWLRPVAPWKHPFSSAGEALRLVRRHGRRDEPALLPPPTTEQPDLSTEPLTAEGLLNALRVIAGRFRLRPAYDAAFLAWLFDELPTAGLGALRTALVTRRDGAPLGYYACYVRRGGLCHVVCLAAGTESDSSRLLKVLLSDARACGAAAVVGRVEPRLLTAVTEAKSLLLRRPGALIHSRNVELLHVAASSDALMTRLEGEWCLRPQAL